MKIFENTQMSKNSTVCQYNTLSWKIKQYRIEALQDALSKSSKTFKYSKVHKIQIHMQKFSKVKLTHYMEDVLYFSKMNSSYTLLGELNIRWICI